MSDFDSIASAVSKVDVESCECMTKKNTDWILGELNRDVGLSECNQQVIGLLREALAAQGWAALDRLSPEERRASTLLNNLGLLLKAQGDLEGAAALLREALQGSRETLGDKHPSTLASIGNLGLLLKAKGEKTEALVLLSELSDVWGAVHGGKPPKALLDDISELEASM